MAPVCGSCSLCCVSPASLAGAVTTGDVATFSLLAGVAWVGLGWGGRNKINHKIPEHQRCVLYMYLQSVRASSDRGWCWVLLESRRWNVGGSHVSESVTSPASFLNWSWRGKKRHVRSFRCFSVLWIE